MRELRVHPPLDGAGVDAEHGSDRLTSERFRFRFVARGDQANALVVVAAKSLRRCHPNAEIVVVDANEAPTLDPALFGIGGRFAIVHVCPGDDAVARALGRGSRRHLFYWRHSPQVLEALPVTRRHTVYADADVLFVRPMDLASLLRPLARGRIAAGVDESWLEYYHEIQGLSATPAGNILPAAGTGGPLLQGGLLFTNAEDDGGFYDRFWELAARAAGSGLLDDLPWDDMCLITALLGQGGPLWERLLTLAPEWNFITDTRKEPGVLACATHYGGRTAQAHLLAQRGRLFPKPPEVAAGGGAWGTVASPLAAPTRAPWHGRARSEPLAVPIPFALTWAVPPGARSCTVCVTHEDDGAAALLIHVDGRLVERVPASGGLVTETVRFARAETLTVVGAGRSHHRCIVEEPSFASPGRVLA